MSQIQINVNRKTSPLGNQFRIDATVVGDPSIRGSSTHSWEEAVADTLLTAHSFRGDILPPEIVGVGLKAIEVELTSGRLPNVSVTGVDSLNSEV